MQTLNQSLFSLYQKRLISLEEAFAHPPSTTSYAT